MQKSFLTRPNLNRIDLENCIINLNEDSKYNLESVGDENKSPNYDHSNIKNLDRTSPQDRKNKHSSKLVLREKNRDNVKNALESPLIGIYNNQSKDRINSNRSPLILNFDDNIETKLTKKRKPPTQNDPNLKRLAKPYLGPQKQYIDFDRPLPIINTQTINGSPFNQVISRKGSIELAKYYQNLQNHTTKIKAPLGRAKIIIVGTNHRNTAFYQLVHQLITNGKRIKAVFMEEVNADEIALATTQNIIDRFFVENPAEFERLNFAHQISALNQTHVIDHLHSEASEYLGNNALTKEYLTNFFQTLSDNNIEFGGIDHSLYRQKDRNGNGYDHNRFSNMNYFAAQVIKSYISKHSEFLESSDDGIILVSIGNAHNINGHKSIPNSETKILGLSTLLDKEIPTAAISSVTMITDANIAAKHSQHIHDFTFNRKNKIEDSSLRSALLSTKYLSITDNNSKAKNDANLLADIIHKPLSLNKGQRSISR